MDDAVRAGFQTEVQLAPERVQVELAIVIERRDRDSEDSLPARRVACGCLCCSHGDRPPGEMCAQA